MSKCVIMKFMHLEKLKQPTFNFHLWSILAWWSIGCVQEYIFCELSVAQLVRFLVMEHVHHGPSPRLGTGACIFLNLF
jgi:hypothetical protein